jgi:hypothetical protein
VGNRISGVFVPGVGVLPKEGEDVRPRHKQFRKRILGHCTPPPVFFPVCLDDFSQVDVQIAQGRGTSLIRNTPLLGPLSRTMPRALRRL